MSTGRYSTPIDLASSTVLITGGSGGIGYGLAERFLKSGSQVIITGRREDQLKEAKRKLNSDKLVYHVGDVGKEADRVKLFQWVTKEYPKVNVLMNNAGIQRRISFLDDIETPWNERENEIHINFSAPVHLSSLFVSYFLKQQQPSAIINITGGLAFIPPAFAPAYGATKAALHSFTMSIRFDLANTPVQVIEIAPPAVKTDLGGSHDFGEDLDEFCDHVFGRMKQGEQEIGYKTSEEARLSSREKLDQMFQGVNNHLKKVLEEMKKH
ncbi:unnamed protein product [Didymodactylos carnosus]|nr:unnamed protein product [Didymodactylos carnosus]